MNSPITNSSSTLETPAVTPQNDSLRCRHHFSNGKRCRLPGLASQSGLCSRHFLPIVASSPLYPSDFTDLSADLLPGLSHFRSSEDLREFLSRLLIETTKGRVSPRRAAVLAYITNQLLHSHCVVQKEEKELDNQEQPIIFDLPRPQRDWPEGSERALYRRMSSHSAPNNVETPNSTNTKESS